MKHFNTIEDFRRMDSCAKGLFVTTFVITVLELIFYLVIPISGQIFLQLDSHFGATGIALWWCVALILMALIILDMLFLLRKEKAGKLANFCFFVRLIKVAVVFVILGYFIHLNLTLKPDDWVKRLKDLFKYSVKQDDLKLDREADA